jgi:hypothetical protein
MNSVYFDLADGDHSCHQRSLIDVVSFGSFQSRRLWACFELVWGYFDAEAYQLLQLFELWAACFGHFDRLLGFDSLLSVQPCLQAPLVSPLIPYAPLLIALDFRFWSLLNQVFGLQTSGLRHRD